jgi:hypothetical protein
VSSAENNAGPGGCGGVAMQAASNSNAAGAIHRHRLTGVLVVMMQDYHEPYG